MYSLEKQNQTQPILMSEKEKKIKALCITIGWSQ